MARYAVTRERNLRGMGTTYSFVPRRTLRGLGQTSDSDIDVVTGYPCDDPRANCGPLEPTTMIPAPTQLGPPPSFFTFPAPIIPPARPQPVPPAPIITQPLPIPTAPSPIAISPTIVFPSGGGPTRPPGTAAPGWLDQQLISGFPNKYLALGTIAAVLFMSISQSGRRR
jgi:hypothetical protein